MNDFEEINCKIEELKYEKRELNMKINNLDKSIKRLEEKKNEIRKEHNLRVELLDIEAKLFKTSFPVF